MLKYEVTVSLKGVFKYIRNYKDRPAKDEVILSVWFMFSGDNVIDDAFTQFRKDIHYSMKINE